MKFKRIEIKNYRSLEDIVVDLNGLTVLIGANNAGKTSILCAMDMFGSSGRMIGTDDFNDPEKDVELALTMECRDGEMGIPKRFCVNGEFTIKKTYSLNGGKVTLAHFAKVLLNSEFENLRSKWLSTEIRPEIRRLQARYTDLPGYAGGKAKWREKFVEYDRDFYLTHPDDPKTKEYYVPWNDSEVPLESLVDIVHVPSMRNIANDGGDGSESYLTKLITMAIEDAQGSDPELAAVIKTSMSDYGSYVRAIKKSVVRELNASLAKHSGRYVKNSIAIEIRPPTRVLPAPIPSIVTGDNGRRINIEHAGGGIQRVYLMALLETISEWRGKAMGKRRAARAKLLMVDEPELYQHPQRQRHMLLTLVGLASASKGAVQVMCSTHSPYFIDLGQVDGLRLVRRGSPTRILRTTLEGLLDGIPGPRETRPGSPEELRTWLDINSTHWVTEGFFSKTAVVLEGPGDRNMLLATAKVLGVDLNQHEMSLVPANGKDKITYLVHIFRTFEIPVYVVWDLDYRPGSSPTTAQKGHNEPILKLISVGSPGNHKDLDKTEINDRFSCFGTNMTTSLAKDLERCEELLAGMDEYKELQEAKRVDESASSPNRRRNEQKHVLNSRETVFRMLKAIQDKDPGRLKTFDVVKVVRRLEKTGKRNATAA